MADARDRTVATNYAREAMENVKNMDFELVTNGNLGTAESVGAKFTRVIIVNTENENLKKIDTKVSWTNRQDQYVSVDTSMYINRTLLNPGLAAKLVLYADPYYSVLPSIDETIDLFAVIKDANGNTKIDWSGENICFTIISGSDLGSLPAGASGGVDTNNGIAQTIFTPSEYAIGGVLQQGDVVIEASVELPNSGGTISDIITITVTLGVVRIELNASPISIEADGITTSTVTATLVDARGDKVTDAPNKITFNILGEGIFVDSASGGLHLPDTLPPMPNSEGIAIIYVESIDETPGVAIVTAISEGLLSDTVNIITTGIATSISVSVDPDLIYFDDIEGARVTVEIQDINGIPVEYGEDISLTISGGTGNFTDNPVNPNNTPSATSTFYPTSLGILTITASGVGLEAGTTTIDVRDPLIADTITIKAVPKNILAGGFNNSEITATIKQGSTVISNYKNPITFEIFSDTSSSHDAKLFFNGYDYDTLTVSGDEYGNDGEAVVYLKPASEVGICTIKVSTYNLGDPIPIENTVKVGFYSGEHHIKLSAVPSKMLVNGDTCTVTAEVVDEAGTIVNSYNKDITFTILVGWPKIAKFIITGTSSLTKTLTGGETTVGLISQKDVGTVTLKASSFTGMTNITGYLNIPVVITLLKLALNPNITYSENQVSFDINIQGAALILEEMKVSWLPDVSETLNKIEIKSPSTAADPIIIFDNFGEPASHGELINVDDITLLAGISNVKLYFNESMSGKTLEVIFNPNSGNYPVEINEP